MITNKTDVAALRTLLTSYKEQSCSLMAKFSEPIKKLAESLNSQLGSVLAALPVDEVKNDWCTEDVLNCLFNSLNSANAICTQLTLEVSKMGSTQASVDLEQLIASGDVVRKDAIDAMITAAINARIEAGELIAKTVVDQLCSDAKLQGVNEGKTALQAEMAAKAAADALAITRKESLTQASIPLPPAELEAVLRESDENFTAAQTRFATREQELRTAGITLASDELRSNLWLEDAQYKLFSRTVQSIPALKGATEPLAGGPPAAAGKPTRMIV